LEFTTNRADGMAARLRRMSVEDSSASLPERLIGAVVAHSNRWKTADLKITTSLIPLLAPIRDRLSLLTELTIMSFGNTVQPFSYAGNAPRLTDITLVDYPHELLNVPWSSIRRFSETQLMYGRNSSVNQTERCLKMLRDNPQLESLDVTYSSAAPSSSKSALTHRSLRRLATAEGNLIRCLTLPNLEEIVVEPRDDTMAAIRGLLKRSKCTLRSLRLIDFLLDTDVLAVLSSCTKLQTLVVRLTGWDAEIKEVMDLLVKKLAEPSFLPCLEDLDIIISRDYDEFDAPPMKRPCTIGFINDTFVEMIAARWGRRTAAQGRAHLKRVFVLVELPSTVGLSKTRGVERLQKMCDEGLDVLLKARDPRALDLSQDAKELSYVYNV
jgi:hypothetical protein